MSELAAQIELFLAGLLREGASAHTLDAYRSDLEQFAAAVAPDPRAIDLLMLRQWLAGLYGERFSVASIRRKLAAVRSLFRHMLREGVIPANTARLIRTPKAPKRLPEVMSEAQANA